MTTSAFRRFLDSNNIIVGIVADIVSESIVIHGDPALLDSNRILHYYFTNSANLNAHLADRILPLMLQEGAVAGVVSKLDENTIIGLLYHDERPVLDRYHHSKILGKQLQSIWEEKP